MAEARVLRLEWAGGDCLLQMSSSTHGLPVRRPLVSAHMELRIDGFLEDGRWHSRRSIGLPILMYGARRLTVPSSREAVVRKVIMEHHMWLPEEWLRCVGEELSRYICDVAAATARAEAAPLLTEVHADARVRRFSGEEPEDVEEEEEPEEVEEEEEEGDDDVDWEGMQLDDYGETLFPSELATTETAAIDGQLVPEEEEEAVGDGDDVDWEGMQADDYGEPLSSSAAAPTDTGAIDGQMVPEEAEGGHDDDVYWGYMQADDYGEPPSPSAGAPTDTAAIDGQLVPEEEEEEEEEEEVDFDWTDWGGIQADDYGEQPSPSTAASTGTVIIDGHLEPEEGEEEEEEEETCAICLGKMAAGHGQEERYWLPCSHSFHRACLGRWLRRRAQCPLCRTEVAPPGSGCRYHHI